ncbi:DUF6924 domain-containing protein [Lentzea sp.]|uniref:DUF6924 domain-containing protein n=1 Tax=Lentzea sp. TaxID=56099 RepID=UPI002ED68792
MILPESELSPLLRTDFTDEQAWQSLLEEIDTGWLTVLADPGHQGLTVPELVALVPSDRLYPLLVVADEQTFASAERSVLLIDVREEPGRAFRAVLDAANSAIGNLAIDNNSFDDYLDGLDDSGVYRLSARYHQALAELMSFNQPAKSRTFPARDDSRD